MYKQWCINTQVNIKEQIQNPEAIITDRGGEWNAPIRDSNRSKRSLRPSYLKELIFAHYCLTYLVPLLCPWPQQTRATDEQKLARHSHRPPKFQDESEPRRFLRGAVREAETTSTKCRFSGRCTSCSLRYL